MGKTGGRYLEELDRLRREIQCRIELLARGDEEEAALLQVELAPEYEQVRGKHYVEWWPEVDRLERLQQEEEYRQLLLEIRDAAERGTAVAGYTVTPAPTLRLAALHEKQGNMSAAVEVLERYLAVIGQFRQMEPTGGDTGWRNIQAYLERLRSQVQ